MKGASTIFLQSFILNMYTYLNCILEDISAKPKNDGFCPKSQNTICTSAVSKKIVF